MANPPFIILSCDGGGVRGVITAKLLQSLDPAFLQSVSLFAGTSTGSIIALGLAAGVPIGTIVSLYESMSNCNEIFTPYLNQAQSRALRAQIAAAIPPQTAAAGEEIDWSKILQLVMEAAEQMAFPKYQSTGLQTLLTANFPAMTLAQLATQRQKYVVVPSFRISPGQNNAWAACVFHNLPGLTTTPDLSATSLIDTAMCSAAAPLFFPPHTIAPGSFVDGGVCANNPCTVAAACYSGSSLSGANGPAPGSVAAVSLGTGDVSNSYPPSDAVFPGGILGWMWPYQDGTSPAFPLIEAMFAGSSQINDLTAQMMLRGSTYIRANPVFTQTYSLDDCTDVAQMASLTDQYIASSEWQQIAKTINGLVSSG